MIKKITIYSLLIVTGSIMGFPPSSTMIDSEKEIIQVPKVKENIEDDESYDDLISACDLIMHEIEREPLFHTFGKPITEITKNIISIFLELLGTPVAHQLLKDLIRVDFCLEKLSQS